MKPVQVPNLMSIGITVIELHFFNYKKKKKKEEQHGQNGENGFSHNLDIKWSFHEMFGIQFTFHVLCSTDSLEVVLT